MNTLKTTKLLKKISAIFILSSLLATFGIPVGLVQKVIEDNNIIDKLYLATKSPDVIDKSISELLSPKKVHAADFTMQTGYYMGDGTDNRQITNIGFQPDLILLKDNTAAGSDGILFRTSTMTGERTAKFEAEADVTSNYIQSLDSSGFTLGSNADVNSSQVPYFWTAFAGSDCSSTGTFCVGSYTGNGSSQTINFGFQPDLVVVKRSGASASVWRSSSMPTNLVNYFINTNQDSGGQMIQTFTSTGFTVGNNATVNTSTNTYWYFAFRQVTGKMDVGTYSGTGVDNRNITTTEDSGLTFRPSFAFIKNANATTAVPSVFSITENYGDRSFLTTDAASAANNIQELRTAGGFQVGTSTNVNATGNTFYYAAFGGSVVHSASGTFSMANGSYTGNGTSQSITSAGFKPDLVMVKHTDQTTDQYAVFRIKDMKGDTTAYLANAVSNFTGGITSLDNTGFTVGANATVNTIGDTYHWVAFGNAWDYEDHSGASDFIVGSYIGDGLDNRNIDAWPFQPDLVAVKRLGSTVGSWRTSNMSGDNSLFFSATAQSTNIIQQFNSDGFQRGTNAGSNTAGGTYWYFAFKNGTNFTVNNYTGNSSTQNIVNTGFQPDLIWTKKSTGGTARGGVLRSSSQVGDSTLPFINAANLTGRITSFLSNGFSLGSGVEANENTGVYRYAAWRIPLTGNVSTDIVDENDNSVGSPSISFNTIDSTFQCQTTEATFGTPTQKIRVFNEGPGSSWTLTLAADNSTSKWVSGGNNYDYNDNGGSPNGCLDSGADVDSISGQMYIDFTDAIIEPDSNCDNTGLTFGSNTAFLEGTTNNIVLVQASGSAAPQCHWDITGIKVIQKIPAEQVSGNYSINMSLTVQTN